MPTVLSNSPRLNSFQPQIYVAILFHYYTKNKVFLPNIFVEKKIKLFYFLFESQLISAKYNKNVIYTNFKWNQIYILRQPVLCRDLI